MVQSTEATRLIIADLKAERRRVYSLAGLLLAYAATMTYCAQAQNIEGQPIAAQYGEFEVQNEGNGFAFDPANCNVTGGGHSFPAFSTGTPVKVVDALPAQTEISTAVTAFLSGSNCAVSLAGLAYQHTSFYLTSGTGGLQEALNNEKIRAGGNNTIILNARWYELIAPRTASTVISTVSGSYSIGLVDITTNPYTSYNWNGSQYVQAAAASGGSPSGGAGGALSGNYPNPGLSGLGQANGVASLDVLGHVPVGQLPTSVPLLTATAQQTFSSGLYAPQINNVFWVDGFSTGAYGGIGQAQLAWASGTTYPLCQAVSYSGGNYLATSTAASTTTPGTSSAIWYPVPTNDSPTQTECAFYWALATGVSRTSPIVLKFGGTGSYNGTYGINGPLVMPPTGQQVELIGESRGDNGAPVQIFAQAAMTVMVSKPDLAAPASTPYNLHLAHLILNGNNLASHGFEFDGAKVGLIEHVNVKNMVGTDYWVRLGDGTAPSSEGYDYQWVVNDVQLESAGQGPSSWGTITSSVSGGVPTFTLASGGSYNYATPVIHVWGTGASGTSNQPCTAMGTITPTMSGTGPYTIASISATGFSGCGGTIYILAPDQPAAQYGFFIDYVTDSSFTDLIDNGVGTVAGIITNHSGNSFLHAHPYGVPVGIISNNQNMFVNTEIDSTFVYGAEPNAKDNWANTNFTYNQSYPGSKGFYTGSQTTFNSLNSSCGGTTQASGFALVTTATGDIAHGAATAYPAAFRVMGQQCDDSSQVVALPAISTPQVTAATGNIGALTVTSCSGCSGNAGSVLQADNFSAYSSCIARGAWSSSNAYNKCDTVTNGGLTWIAVNANTNVTPVQSSLGGTQNWLQFRSDGANVAATMADYAFFSAYALVNLNSASFSSNASVSLVFGAPVGGYLKNGDWVMPSNTYGYTISLFGQGRGQTIITQNYTTLNYMVAQPPASSSGGQTITGIEFNANLLAAGCLDAHIRRSTYRDLVCFNPQYQSGQTQIGSQSWNSASTAATFLFGYGGDSYELDVSQILTRTPAYSGLVGAIGTATVTSGAITGISYTGTGTSLNLPVTAGPGLVAYFMGKGSSGTSYQPCGTMPVVSAIALTGGSINTATGVGGLTFSNAGATCGGTIYVVIQQAGTIPYGYYFGGTDSSFKDVVSSGDFTQACQYDNHGSNVFDHEHPYCKAPYQIVANGGGPGQATDTHKGLELDSPTQYGVYVLRGGETFNSYSAEWNSTTAYPGAGEFLFDATANNFNIGPSWCGGSQQAGGYAKYTGTTTGPITASNAATVMNTLQGLIYGNQNNCDGSQTGGGLETLWGTYMGNVSAGTVTATGGLAALSDGVHAGYDNLVGNTTNPAITANTAGLLGPSAASFTAYALQLPNAGPSATSVFCAATLASAVSAVTFCNAPTISAANMTSFPTFNQSTTGNAATATTATAATNLAGTGVDYAPYQSASATTSYITAPTTSARTFVYAWQPNGSAVAPTAIDLGTYLASPPAIGGTAAAAGSFTTLSAASAGTFSAAGAASTPGLTVSGAPYTGGSSTTTFPQFYLNAGAAVTTFSTSGTMLGVNAPSGFAGHLINLFTNGSSTKFRVDASGNTFVAGTSTLAGNVGFSNTNAPTMAAGAAAGTAPTCTSVTGNNNTGLISCTTGTATAASGTLATVTFNGTLGTTPAGCTLFPRNANTALLATDVYTTAPSTTSFTIAVGATAPAVSTAYVWSYACL